MEMDRRRLLHLLGSGVLLSGPPSNVSASSTARTNARGGLAALLVPVSGASGQLGLDMQRATGLAQSGSDGKAVVKLFDTDGSAEGAARAAALAERSGAAAILGPLFGHQVRSVAAAVGDAVPIIAFSNNLTARVGQSFEFGITPSQSVSAVLQYAQTGGARRVALIGAGTGWSEQARKAAQRIAPEVGLQLVDVSTPGDGGGPDLVQAVRRAAGGAPDAALLTGGGPRFAAQAQALQRSGVQVLGTLQAMNQSSPALASLEGVWLSTPDPARFAEFAQLYRASAGKEPGVIAALAFDAARIVDTLAQKGRLNREGLLSSTGFPATTGAVRFRDDGRCVRELAIVTVSSGRLQTLARKAGL